jgi:hypothetical protein
LFAEKLEQIRNSLNFGFNNFQKLLKVWQAPLSLFVLVNKVTTHSLLYLCHAALVPPGYGLAFIKLAQNFYFSLVLKFNFRP